MNTATRFILSAALPLLFANPALAKARPAAAETAAAPTRTFPHISVRTVGKGSPVILIPGLSSPRSVWDGVVPGLAAKHRVLLVQINGFAGEDPGANLKPGILDGVVADLHQLIAAERIGAAAVVGHSLGGLVGMKLAQAHPDDVGHLMIVDSLPFYGALFGPTATVAMVEPRGAAMRDAIVASYGKPADPAMTRATAERLALKPDSRDKVAAWAAAADPRVTGQAMYEDLVTDLRPALPTIATPMTVVVPYNSALPQTQASALYHGAFAGAPHVEFVEVGDSAHFVMLDQPEAFGKALDTFLAK